MSKVFFQNFGKRSIELLEQSGHFEKLKPSTGDVSIPLRNWDCVALIVLQGERGKALISIHYDQSLPSEMVLEHDRYCEYLNLISGFLKNMLQANGLGQFSSSLAGQSFGGLWPLLKHDTEFEHAHRVSISTTKRAVCNICLTIDPTIDIDSLDFSKSLVPVIRKT